MATEDRFLHHLIGGKPIGYHDLRRLDRYATHFRSDGHFYEYDQGRYWYTNLLDDEPQRIPIDDESEVPFGPWYHHPLCTCEDCRTA